MKLAINPIIPYTDFFFLEPSTDNTSAGIEGANGIIQNIIAQYMTYKHF